MQSIIWYKDFYKAGHYEQYPKGTSLIFSNFTPRKSLMPGVNYSVFFGLSYFIELHLITAFAKVFFNIPEDDLLNRYEQIMQTALHSNIHKKYDHIRALHKLGYLPIAIHALDEGTKVPCGVPALTIYNTHPDFFWLPNMLETMISCTLWGPCTSATIAHEYRKILDHYAEKTSDNLWFVDYQAHDFSMRGMNCLDAAITSGGAHLLSFKGSDTIPAGIWLKDFYNAPDDCISSVPATEHSVMSAGGKENEIDTFIRLLTEVYPSGIVSIVSDTWDLWNVVDNFLPRLKDIIMKRDGKLVIRPDSGNPVEIICGHAGTKTSLSSESEYKGLIECLWDIFGGTINSKGYKELDPHIGAIYGDSITLDRCRDICERLEQKGFSSTNIVFGIGSYTYQYNTRDTLGWAMKATYAEITGAHGKIGVPIYKDPKTDNGTKKSHKGLLKVVKENGKLVVKENVSWKEFESNDNELQLRFLNGRKLPDESSQYYAIRKKIKE